MRDISTLVAACPTSEPDRFGMELYHVTTDRVLASSFTSLCSVGMPRSAKIPDSAFTCPQTSCWLPGSAHVHLEMVVGHRMTFQFTVDFVYGRGPIDYRLVKDVAIVVQTP